MGDIRADHDANCTYEGENNVLVQQASNWLLNQWSAVKNGELVVSPLNSANFLNEAESILQQHFKYQEVNEVIKLKSISYLIYLF